MQALVDLGYFFLLLFGGLGLLLVGVGIMKWGTGQEEKGKKGQ